MLDMEERRWNLWVDEADRFDRMLGGYGSLVLERAELALGDRVLDVGCGTGALTRLAARTVGIDGTVTGIDLDAAVVAMAISRAAEMSNVVHRQADAMGARGGPFDAIVSRFAVMLLVDHRAGLAHLGSLLRPGGRLSFCVWAEPSANEWFTLPFNAVGVPIPESAPAFALADRGRLVDVLMAAGLADVSVERVERDVWLGRDVDDVVAFLAAHLGTRADDLDPALVARARVEIEPRGGPDGVTVASAAWLCAGRVPGRR